VVAGSITMNTILTTDRHPRAGETVISRGIRLSFGGKGANQAVAARRTGADVVMIGMVGTDDHGARLLEFLRGEAIDVTGVQQTAAQPTGASVCIVDASGQSMGVSTPGANRMVEASLIDSSAIRQGDVAVCSCVIPMEAVGRHLANARNAKATAMVNVAPVLPGARELLELADIIIVNEVELRALSDTDEVAEGMKRIKKRQDQIVVTTLGSEGWTALIADQIQAEPGHAVPALDTTGAGDCFVGSLAARLAAGTTIRDALSYANRAAALLVQRPGESVDMPRSEEVVGE
jgi:ribokinase